MGIPALLVFTTVALLADNIEGGIDNGLLKCTGSTFYKVKKNGEASCRECPSCKGGGIGWDTTEKRREDEHGFRSCYKCVECKPGTYRELGSRDSECQSCSVNCNLKKRYGSVKCGGASPGHCGDCWTGYYANSKEPNSMCTKKITALDEIPTSPKAPEPRSEEQKKDYSFTTNLTIWISGAVLLTLIMIVIACAVVSAKCQKRTKKNKKTAAASLVSDSSKALISSGSSFGEDGLETDGVCGVPERKVVRRELPEEVTIGEIEAMRFVRSLASKPNEALIFNDRILEIGDETIDVVAHSVHGERRHELFQTYLKIEKSKTSPEEEKWEKNINPSFPDYIREVLKIWLQKADKDATLKALCVALEKAGFHDVVEKVLELPENHPVFVDDLKVCSEV